MSIYAISDLHLSFETDKPMDEFGSNWKNYERVLAENWKKTVKEEDLVLLPGDFSWALYLHQAKLDFSYLAELPGKKILSKGNHDYWWSTLTAMRKFLKENQFTKIDFLYNNSYLFENHVIVGARGWNFEKGEGDEKILKREEIRLRLSLEDGVKRYGTEKEMIACMHYPPFHKRFIDILKEYPVKMCIYGHLHGKAQESIKDEIIDGISFHLVSADHMKFALRKLV